MASSTMHTQHQSTTASLVIHLTSLGTLLYPCTSSFIIREMPTEHAGGRLQLLKLVVHSLSKLSYSECRQAFSDSSFAWCSLLNAPH